MFTVVDESSSQYILGACAMSVHKYIRPSTIAQLASDTLRLTIVHSSRALFGIVRSNSFRNNSESFPTLSSSYQVVIEAITRCLKDARIN